MPRFAILEHDWPTRHWDLLLEHGTNLKSWRLLKAPHPGQFVYAEPIADHRLLYLDYEGEVSGDRGTVTQWDTGVYEGEIGETWAVQWVGKRSQGIARLMQTDDGSYLFGTTVNPII